MTNRKTKIHLKEYMVTIDWTSIIIVRIKAYNHIHAVEAALLLKENIHKLAETEGLIYVTVGKTLFDARRYRATGYLQRTLPKYTIEEVEL